MATGTLYLTKEAGGLTILNKQVVKVWQAFDAAGNGVAARGRYFGGFVDIRTEGNMGVTKYWQIPCVSFHVALKVVVRDAAPSMAFTVTAGTFAAQVLQIVQTVQRNGLGVVALEIDATSQVANLASGLPAWTAPPGKDLDFYLKEACRQARIIDTALRPAYFIDTGRTFGVGDTFGGPVLHVYDAALTPSPVYTFSDTPSGAEKSIYGELTRELESQGMVQRKQAVFQDNFVATYQNTTSADTYPNPLINHGRPGDAGYWQVEAVKDTESTTFAEAEAALALQVQPVEYPKERVTLPEVYDIVLPGEVVTVEHSLHIPTPTNYRVVEADFNFEDPTQVSQSLTLGTRRRELLDEAEEAAGARPVEGDLVGPEAPGTPVVLSEVYNPGLDIVTVTWNFTASPSADAGPYYSNLIVDGIPLGDRWLGADYGAAEPFSWQFRPGATYSVKVRADDTSENVGEWSGILTDTVPDATLPPVPTSFAVAASGVTRHNLAWRRLSWAAPVYSYIGGYQIEWWLSSDITNKAMFTSPADATTTLAPETVTGEEYSYRIRTVSTGGLPGAWTATITSTVSVYSQHDGQLDFDSTEPGVAFTNWPADLVSTTGLAALPDRARSTTEVLSGIASMALTLDAAPESIYSISKPVAIRTGDVLAFRLARKVTPSGAGSANAYLQWLDKAGAQVGADVTLWVAAPTTSWVTFEPAQQTAPATATAFRIKLGFVSSGLWSGRILYWAAPVWSLVKGSNDIAPGAVGNTQLGTITDPLKFPLDIEGGDLTLTRSDGANVEIVSYLSPGGVGMVQFVPGVGAPGGRVFQGRTTFEPPLAFGAANYTVNVTLDSEIVVYMDASGAARTITLPTAASFTGRIYIIKKIDSSANTVTVDANGAETIDGALTKVLSAQYQAIIIQSNGSTWYIIGSHP